MRALVLLFVLSACAVPDYYARLEDPAVARECVARMTGQKPHKTLPFIVVKVVPFWVNYGGQRRRAIGLWSHTGDVRVITIVRGSRMAESLFHELGHSYGLRIVAGHDYAEDLVRRMGECK